jgi:hypothetical protein
MKFKVGQVVAMHPDFCKNLEYHRISGVGFYSPFGEPVVSTNGNKEHLVYFVDGDLPVIKNGLFVNGFYFPFHLRKLTAREAGRE